MRLLRSRACRLVGESWHLYPLQQRCYSPDEIQALMMKHRSPISEVVSGLALDFCGESILLYDENDLRLAAKLVAAYHNCNVRENIQVRIFI